MPDNVEYLLNLIASGDRNAFEVLFEKEHKKVNSFALRITRSKEQAEEIVQDVFLKIWVNRSNLTGISNWSAYLNTMVRHHSFNFLRRLALEIQAGNELGKVNTEIDNTTEKEIEFRGTRALLEEAITSLPAQQQKVYRMCHIEGLKYAETAELLNISAGTVQSHMKQALSSLRKYLARYAPLVVFTLAIGQHDALLERKHPTEQSNKMRSKKIL